MDLIHQLLVAKWHWAVSGFLVSLIMLSLVYFGKTFGLSGTYRTLCAIGGGQKFSDFFKFNWRDQVWNLVVVIGVIIGGYIAHTFFFDIDTIQISESTIGFLKDAGLFAEQATPAATTLLPKEFFNYNLNGLTIIIIGGVLSGFGSRYAGGCTSGHFVTGLSNLQLPSLITLVFFMLGGFITTRVILPLLL